MTPRRALAIAAISLAGCDHLLQLEDIKPNRDAPASDARPDTPPDGLPDAPAEVLCSGDDFNHSPIDVTVWPTVFNNAPSSVVDDGAQLVFTLGSNAPAKYSGVITDYRDFSHMRTVIEVDQVPGMVGATVELAWRNMNGDRLDIYVDGNSIFFGQMTGSGPDEFGTTYDPTQMRWWQIRHDAGAVDVAFDTSPDGVTWTKQHSLFPSVSLVNVAVLLQAGTYNSLGSPGGARLDNFAMIGTCL